MKKNVKAKENTKNRFAIIIPVFNHEEMIGSVIQDAKKLGYPVIVVDDGSTDSTYENIKKIKSITIMRHSENMGKGAAIVTGFREVANSADWAITIDGDGQHRPSDALNLIKAIRPGTRPIVIGMREKMFGSDVPWTSRFGRGFSNFWVKLSGGPGVKDTQSGFRIYPLPESLELRVKAMRYQFELESIVKAKWKRMPVIEAPISVSYSPGTRRVSHFRPFVDFMRNSNVFTRLIFARIFVPSFIRAKKKQQ
jgi:glycosyltransferase involved in cell wall biosynthesis